jgi:hypothetical protein
VPKMGVLDVRDANRRISRIERRIEEIEMRR